MQNKPTLDLTKCEAGRAKDSLLYMQYCYALPTERNVRVCHAIIRKARSVQPCSTEYVKCVIVLLCRKLTWGSRRNYLILVPCRKHCPTTSTTQIATAKTSTKPTWKTTNPLRRFAEVRSALLFKTSDQYGRYSPLPFSLRPLLSFPPIGSHGV